MDDRCITCGNAQCHLDADDWCRAHGWACADHHHDPGLLVGVPAQAAGEAGLDGFAADGHRSLAHPL